MRGLQEKEQEQGLEQIPKVTAEIEPGPQQCKKKFEILLRPSFNFSGIGLVVVAAADVGFGCKKPSRVAFGTPNRARNLIP